MNGLTFINSARILPTQSSWDPGTGYMSGYISLTANTYFPTYLESYTFNLTISYKNNPNNTTTGSFGFDFGEKMIYGAIPSGKIIQLNYAESMSDEIFDSTLSTFIEHSYESNNSVVYVANDDQYILELCPVTIGRAMLLRAKARATITFTLQDKDTGYMDTIIEKYAEGFYAYNMTIDQIEPTIYRIIDGNIKDHVDSFTINKLSSSKFELVMTRTVQLAILMLSYNKGTRYVFSSYSTVSSSTSDFGTDIYLALMRAKVDTKLEFTIIGDYDVN